MWVNILFAPLAYQFETDVGVLDSEPATDFEPNLPESYGDRPLDLLRFIPMMLRETSRSTVLILFPHD